MKLSQLTEVLEGQKMFQIFSQAKELENKGKYVIHFEIGDPDFSTPRKITDKCIEALNGGITHYVGSSGLETFKSAAVKATQRSRGFEPSSNQILVTAGANVQIYYALACICDPGDNVIYGDPAFVSYVSIMRLLGVEPNPVELKEVNSFRINPADIEQSINKRTKAIIINSPHNPTGSVLTKSDINEIYRIAEKYDLFLISDEVYARIIFSEEDKFNSPSSIDACHTRTVLLHSFSKSYAMTGWRIGAVTAPSYLISKMALLLETTSTCVSPFIQIAATEAMTMDQGELDVMVREYEKRRDCLVKLINDMPLVSCTKPSGAFYVMVNIMESGLSDVDFARKLLEEEYVATCPGSYFGVYGAGYIRICFATSLDNINTGMLRMKNFLQKINGESKNK
jgi:aspartate/methionine/tyrosine aminotransferase